MKPLITFSSQQIEVIKSQVFSDDAPGTLLKDFSALLNFIGTDGIETSPSATAFAHKHLAELNALLSRPLAVALKRPMQKSYPHINGLFLLLRASGLTYVAMGKKQTRLMLNQAVLASWAALNPAERYFVLFEAWWERGNGESIGERPGFGFWGHHFNNCILFFKKTLQDQPVDTRLSANDFDRLRYYPGLHHLALMELFGFVAITLDATVNKANWPVVKVEATRWGHAVLGCLSGSFALGLVEEDQTEEKLVMRLLAEIKALRFDVKNTLLLPQSEVLADANVIFNVTLLKASRTLSISSAASLDDLASVILGAFNFDNDHLYEFSYKDVYGLTTSISHPYAENEMGLFTPDYCVGQMPLSVGMNVMFLFDFGDNWEFLLVVEAIDEGKPLSAPKVIKQVGKAPKQYPNYKE